MSTDSAKIFYIVAKLIALAICFCPFLLMMMGILNKFTSEETITSSKMEILDIEEEMPPCATICPFMGFKTPGKSIQVA